MKLNALLACLMSVGLMACPPKVPGSPREPNQVEEIDPGEAPVASPNTKPQDANGHAASPNTQVDPHGPATPPTPTAHH